MRVTITLTDEQVEALRFYYFENSDFTEVESATGVNMFDIVNELAREAT